MKGGFLEPTADRSSGLSPVCRFSWQKILVALLLLALFLFLRLLAAPKLGRLLLVGLPGLAFFLAFPRTDVMLLIAPVAFVLTGSILFDIGGFHPSAPKLLMAGLLVLYLAEKLVWNESFPTANPQSRLLLLFVLIMAASCVISIHLVGQLPMNAFRETLTYVTFAPLMVMVADRFRTRAEIGRITGVLMGIFTFTSLLGIFEYHTAATFYRTDMSIGYIFSTRVSSLMGNPNVFAGYLELTTPIALALGLYHRKTWVRLLSLAAAVLGVLSCLYTFSRGGLVSVVAGSALVLFYRFRRRIWVPITVLLAFMLFLGATAGIFERQISFFTNPTETITQPTLLHRYFSYKSVFREFTESPVLGEGWGAEPFFWGGTQLYSFWEIRHRVSEAPIESFGGLNSLALTFLVRGGLVGGLALISLLAMVAVTSLRAIRRAPPPWGIGIAAGMAGFFLHQTMDNFLQWHFVAPFFWIHLGLATAATRASMRQEERA